MTPSALRRRDVVASAAGQAHRDCVGTSTRAALLHGRDPRTQRRWMDSGPPAAVEFDRFLSVSPDPWRWRAHVDVTAKMQTLDKLSDRQLIERVRELRERQAELEGQDGVLEVRKTVGLAERAGMKERLSAVLAELSAAYLLCAARGLREEQVLS